MAISDSYVAMLVEKVAAEYADRHNNVGIYSLRNRAYAAGLFVSRYECFYVVFFPAYSTISPLVFGEQPVPQYALLSTLLLFHSFISIT